MSLFTECPPLLALPPDYKMYQVQRSFNYYIGKEGSDEVVIVPKGYRTDGASIPKLFWSLIGGPLGKYAPAAIVHDFILEYDMYPRKRCDEIFEEALGVLGVGWFKRKLMYWGVRMYSLFRRKNV